MTKEGLKHRLSETILKFGRGMSAMSCVNSKALSEDKDYKPLKKQSNIAMDQEGHHSECLQENEERELLDTFRPQRIRRSISFTGFSIHEVEHLRNIAESCNADTTISIPNCILPDSRRSRCHSFAGVKSKRLVKITRKSSETAVIDGLLTTTFCSTDL